MCMHVHAGVWARMNGTTTDLSAQAGVTEDRGMFNRRSRPTPKCQHASLTLSQHYSNIFTSPCMGNSNQLRV